VQSVPTLQVVPFGHLPHMEPPQSVPVSFPFLMPSVHDAGAQVPFEQCADVQSPFTRHILLSAHLVQLPPQSTSVSSPFFTLSPHDAD